MLVLSALFFFFFFFFFQAEDGIRDYKVTGVQTCALPILAANAIANRRRLRLSAHRRTRFDERILRYSPFPAAGARTIGGGIQNRFRNNCPERPEIARSRNSDRVPRSHARSFENVFLHRAEISARLVAGDFAAQLFS